MDTLEARALSLVPGDIERIITNEEIDRRTRLSGHMLLVNTLRDGIKTFLDNLEFHALEAMVVAQQTEAGRGLMPYSGDVSHWLTLVRRLNDPDDNPSERTRYWRPRP